MQFEVATTDSEETSDLFTMEPRQGKLQFFEFVGILKAGSKKEVTITFKPVEAKVIIASAVFKFVEGEHTGQRVLKMSGIGKFPFVSINHEKLDFESLTVGKDAHKTIQLRNYSLVKA